MKWLKILLGFSAILVAGCAAYFSVTGLGLLFSGAALSVMIMAGSLEFAKLVGATYLKQKWTELKGFNKWYLTLSVGILMVITSAGIFGYLSNAFQQQSIKLDQVDREISVWNNKIKLNDEQVKSLTVQLSSLQSNQTTIIDKGKINRTLLRSVDSRDKQVAKLQDKIGVYQDSTVKYNQYINDIKNTNIGLEREIGGFRFVAEAFNVDLKTVVKFFILLIIFVFDPLAIALIIAFNQMLMFKKKDEPKDDGVNPQDLMGEVSRVRLTNEDLSTLEKYLSHPPKPNADLKNGYDTYVEETDEIIPTPEEETENNKENIFHDEKELDEQKFSTITPEVGNYFQNDDIRDKILPIEEKKEELEENIPLVPEVVEDEEKKN